MSTLMRMAGYGGLPFGEDLIRNEEARESSQDILKRDPLREHAEEAWPAKNGHKAGCFGYYAVEKCECQRPDWKPCSAGNYPFGEPNPPIRERDPRDRD